MSDASLATSPDSQASVAPQRRKDHWESMQRYPTPRGVATRVHDVAQYLRVLNEGHATDAVKELESTGVTLNDVVLYRLFVRGRLDKKRFEAALKDLTSGGVRFCVGQCRLSGSENQRDGASGPAQERDTVLQALQLGEKRILVVCEVLSASAGSPRAVFPRLLQCVEKRLVRVWIASMLDRITRAPKDAVAFTEAIEKTRTELRTPNHRGTVNAYEALSLILQFIIGSYHIIAIRAGNARGWRKRIDEGQWPGTPLPGMLLDEKKRPSWTPEARKAIARLFELLDQDEHVTPLRAMEIVCNEVPKWWVATVYEQADKPPSLGRVLRILRAPAVVEGRQEFDFRDEKRTADYPGLKDVVARDRFDRVQMHLIQYSMHRKRQEGSAWTRLLHELNRVHQHSIAAVAEETDGALEWTSDGELRVVCRHCRQADPTVVTTMNEVDPFYADIELLDGEIRKGVPVPVFKCETCIKTTRPIMLGHLELLLSGCRRLTCPHCHSGKLKVQKETVYVGPGVPLGAHASCMACKFDFWFDLLKARPEERFRYLHPESPKAFEPETRNEPSLFLFDPPQEAIA